MLRSKVGCPPNFFLKSQNMHMDNEKMQKKFKKNPGTVPVPGLNAFFRVNVVVKNTLGPGTGTVPGFFLNFLHCQYVYFEILKENLVGNQLYFCPIKSLFKQYLGHLLPGYYICIFR